MSISLNVLDRVPGSYRESSEAPDQTKGEKQSPSKTIDKEKTRSHDQQSSERCQLDHHRTTTTNNATFHKREAQQPPLVTTPVQESKRARKQEADIIY